MLPNTDPASTDSEIAEREAEANKAGIALTIWSVKEVENFLIVPEAIARLLAQRSGKTFSESEIDLIIQGEVDKMKDEAFDAAVETARSLAPAAGVKGATAIVRPEFSRRWAASNGRGVVCGKDLLTAIFRWAQVAHRTSLSTHALINEIRSTEIPTELTTAIRLVTSKR